VAEALAGEAGLKVAIVYGSAAAGRMRPDRRCGRGSVVWSAVGHGHPACLVGLVRRVSREVDRMRVPMFLVDMEKRRDILKRHNLAGRWDEWTGN
jgi:hypothetical protein